MKTDSCVKTDMEFTLCVQQYDNIKIAIELGLI